MVDATESETQYEILEESKTEAEAAEEAKISEENGNNPVGEDV